MKNFLMTITSLLVALLVCLCMTVNCLGCADDSGGAAVAPAAATTEQTPTAEPILVTLDVFGGCLEIGEQDIKFLGKTYVGGSRNAWFTVKNNCAYAVRMVPGDIAKIGDDLDFEFDSEEQIVEPGAPTAGVSLVFRPTKAGTRTGIATVWISQYIETPHAEPGEEYTIDLTGIAKEPTQPMAVIHAFPSENIVLENELGNKAEVALGTTLFLDGRWSYTQNSNASIPVDGYEWSFDGPADAAGLGAHFFPAANVPNPRFQPDRCGDYGIWLKVHDGYLWSGTAEFHFHVPCP